MNILHYKYYNKRGLIIFIIGVVLCFSSLFIDKYKFNTYHYSEIPKFGTIHLLKTLLIFVSTILIYFGLIKLIKLKEIKVFNRESNSYSKLVIFITFTISIIFTFIHIISQPLFYLLSREDGIVENFSAFFLFISSVIFFVSWVIQVFRKGTQQLNGIHHIISGYLHKICSANKGMY
mgnify:CR=1 FL=1